MLRSIRLSLFPTLALQVRFDWRLFLAVLLAVVSWASAFAGIRVGLKSYSPQSVALLRYLVASLALVGYAAGTRMPLPRRSDLPGIAITGIIGIALYSIALNAGEKTLAAGSASLIIASAPIFVALLAYFVFAERFSGRAWVGILLSFAGAALIAIEPGEGFQFSLSALLVLAAAIAQAVYSVAQKPYLVRYGALAYVTYAIWAGTLFLLPFLPGLIKEMAAAAPASTAAVVYMGLFPGVIGYGSWSYVLSRLPAARAGSFLYLVPAVAILIAWLWLGEIPQVTAVIGGLLILGGVVLVNGGKRLNHSDR